LEKISDFKEERHTFFLKFMNNNRRRFCELSESANPMSESIFEDLRRFCDETETTTTKKKIGNHEKIKVRKWKIKKLKYWRGKSWRENSFEIENMRKKVSYDMRLKRWRIWNLKLIPTKWVLWGRCEDNDRNHSRN
jgi:hypothetical protein